MNVRHEMTDQPLTPVQEDYRKAEAAYQMWAFDPSDVDARVPEFHTLPTKEIDKWLEFSKKVAMHDHTFTARVHPDVEKYGSLTTAPTMWDYDEAKYPRSKPLPKYQDQLAHSHTVDQPYDLSIVPPSPTPRWEKIKNTIMIIIQEATERIKELRRTL